MREIGLEGNVIRGGGKWKVGWREVVRGGGKVESGLEGKVVMGGRKVGRGLREPLCLSCIAKVFSLI